MAHTKGPWFIIPREIMEDGSVFPRHLLGGERGELICFLEGQAVADIAVKQPGTHWDTSPKKEDNARLIAAAPELLKALTTKVDETEQFLFEAWLCRVYPSGDVESVHGQWLESSDYREFFDEWREQIDAIAKATGAAP